MRRRTSTGAGAAAGGRVLIVDDERPVAEATGLLLEIEGFEVSVASSEREALDCVRSFSPDVIVSDYHLRGGETGAGVVAAVRDQARLDDSRYFRDRRYRVLRDHQRARGKGRATQQARPRGRSARCRARSDRPAARSTALTVPRQSLRFTQLSRRSEGAARPESIECSRRASR